MDGRAPLLFQDLTRIAAGELARDGLVVVPVGATEQHGPHLPSGTDFFHAEWVTRAGAALAAETIPVCVAPTLPFGCSPHHLPFGATLSISTETYYRVLVDLCESLVAGGWRRIFIVNGHGGNHELIQLAARDVALKHPVDVAAASWWALAWDALVAEGAHEIGRMPGHAGAFETSLVLAMRPELVSDSRPHRDDPGRTDPARGFPPLVRTERHAFWQSINGHSDSPDLGDGAAGQRYLDASARELARALVEFWETTRQPLAG